MPSTRRQFLQLGATAVAALGLSRNTRAAARATVLRTDLGFSLYGMKTVPLHDAVSHCARIGYHNIELALMPGYPTDPAKFAIGARRELQTHVKSVGLRVSSLIANLSLVGPAAAQSGVLEMIKVAGELSHQLDDRNPPLLQTILGGKPDAWDASKDEMVTRLRAWADAAASADITIAVKAHVSHATNTPERLLWLHRQVASPRIALAYDFSHFDAAGLSLEQSLRAIAPHMRFIHVKDLAPGEKPARFLLPGEGTTDYPRYFRLLDELGYRGPVVVEVSSQIFSQPGYDPIRAAEKSYAALTKHLV